MWKGPEKDGITQSLLNKFQVCPFSFYIYAILGLKEEEKEFPKNLAWGDTFHVGLEHLLKSKDINGSTKKMIAYLNLVWPKCPPSYQYSLRKMLFLYEIPQGDWDTEIEFSQTIDVYGRSIRIRGKKDGMCLNHPEYGRVMIEHKCKGYIDPAQTKQELKEDLQCNLYMYLSDVEWVFYDLIRIPDVQEYGPQRAFDESPRDYIERLYTGPIGSYGGKYPINKNKHQWIHQKPYLIETDQQQDYWNRTLLPLLHKLCLWWDWVNQPGFDPFNPRFYNHIFYKAPIRSFDARRTEKYKCDYHPYLVGEQQLTDLIPVTSYFAELNE